MSEKFNPFEDIFSQENINKTLNQFQNISVDMFSNIIRESEKGVENLTNFIINRKEDLPKPMDKSKGVQYECPFPQREKTITPDDVCKFPDSNNPVKSVKTQETVSNSNGDRFNKINPFEPIKNTDDTINNDSNVEVNMKSVEKNNPIDVEPSKPLTDREILNKTSSLWKYYPVNSYLDTFPDYITEHEISQYAEVLVSRVRGKKHKHNATNCDDYFSYDFIGNCCVVAISDGAGSKKFSRLGAKKVTNQYVKSLIKSLENLLKDSAFMEGLKNPVTDSLFNVSCSKLAMSIQDGVKSSYSAIVSKCDDISQKYEYVEEMGGKISLTDLSCTLLTAIIIPIPTKNGVDTLIATLQIGDGMISAINENAPFDSCIKILGTSDSGDFSGETEFITSQGMIDTSNILKRIKIMKGRVSAIMLATDGVSDDYFPNNTKVANLYRDLQLNGVLPIDNNDDNISFKIVPPIREQKTIEENPKSINIAYSEDIQEFFKINDETLWNDKIFTQNAVSVYERFFNQDRSINLQNWLDNYTKRGSFDDRTLFIYRPTK